MSDGQVERVLRMVRDGLGLVVTGAASTFDQHGRRRSSQPIGELWGETDPERNRQSIALRREAGRGRVAYLPRLELCRPVAPDRDWGYLGYRTFQLPGNWRELAGAVEWAAGGFSVYLDGPETVLAEFLRQPEKGRLLVHLVNYRTDAEAAGLRLRFRPELVQGTGGRVRLLSFDPGERRAEARRRPDGWLEVTVDWLETYAIVVIE
ncbi:MAG: hypothetical protein BWY73_01261 [candidate division TA06 bacterium ADurb.Bin417]|uniref:Beta-galactosidase n=1 Tax=candidate division TA06 bacterium ADurb.Bin417 TaxID=1852828 RepID=A0A1V5MBZ3_UNCT6|nr:MAG: hypothetical protein BWY73_01261 [candidate division TA06 bacterium ADurb.Bin417]